MPGHDNADATREAVPPRHRTPDRGRRRRRARVRGDTTCFRCGETGHTRRQCPDPETKRERRAEVPFRRGEHTLLRFVAGFLREFHRRRKRAATRLRPLQKVMPKPEQRLTMGPRRAPLPTPRAPSLASQDPHDSEPTRPRDGTWFQRSGTSLPRFSRGLKDPCPGWRGIPVLGRGGVRVEQWQRWRRDIILGTGDQGTWK